MATQQPLRSCEETIYQSTHNSGKGDLSVPSGSGSTPTTQAHHLLFLPPEIRRQVYQYLPRYAPKYRSEAAEYHAVFANGRNSPEVFWSTSHFLEPYLFQVCRQLSFELQEFTRRTYNPTCPPVLLCEIDRRFDVDYVTELINVLKGYDAHWVAKQMKTPTSTCNNLVMGRWALEVPVQLHQKKLNKSIDDRSQESRVEEMMNLRAFLKAVLPCLRHTNTMEIYVFIRCSIKRRDDTFYTTLLMSMVYTLQQKSVDRVHRVHYTVIALLSERNECIERQVEEAGLKMRLATEQEAALFP